MQRLIAGAVALCFVAFSSSAAATRGMESRRRRLPAAAAPGRHRRQQPDVRARRARSSRATRRASRISTAKTPTTDDTIYHWASITKTFTGIAIMQLRDRGLLSLDDPVVKYVPELRAGHNPFGDISQVKIRHLMSHSAGFRAATWPWGGDQPWHPFEPTTLGAARRDDAVHRRAVRAGHRSTATRTPASIFLGRIIELSLRRRLRGLRHQEHPDAARHAQHVLRPRAVLPAAAPLAQLLPRRTRASTRRGSTSTPASRSRTAA